MIYFNYLYLLLLVYISSSSSYQYYVANICYLYSEIRRESDQTHICFVNSSTNQFWCISASLGMWASKSSSKWGGCVCHLYIIYAHIYIYIYRLPAVLSMKLFIKCIQVPAPLEVPSSFSVYVCVFSVHLLCLRTGLSLCLNIIHAHGIVLACWSVHSFLTTKMN